MRVALVIEAIDKASRAVRGVDKAVRASNKASIAGANKAAAATEKSAKAVSQYSKAHERAARAVGRAQDTIIAGARRAGEASRAAAAMAQRGWDRALVSIGNYARRQGDLIVKGGGLIGGGAGRIWQGVKAGGAIGAGLATGAGVLGVAGSLLISQLVDPAAEFEKFAAILETTEHSAAAAQKALAWVSDFATRTPYDMAAVTEAFVKMRTYALDPTKGLLQTLGNTAAAMGKPLIQAVEAVADAVTGEFERLKDFGVKGSIDGAYALFSFTATDGTQKVIKALKNDRKAIENALAYIWNSAYGGAMERLSQTWDGMISNLGDQWSRIRLMVMNAGLFDYMKGRLGEILSTIDTMSADGSLQRWAGDVSTTLIATLEKGWAAAKGMAAAIGTVARGAEWLANAMGGWENLSYLLIAAAFAQPIYYLGTGLFMVARGAWVAGFALARVLAILSVSTTMWAFSAGLRLVGLLALGTARSVMLLGRALIFASAGAIRGAVLGIAFLARGLVGLPGLLVRAAAGARLMAIAAMGLPGMLMSAARGIAAMAVAGLRALPGLLASAAQGIGLMAAAGLRALPGLLFAAARSAVAFGVALMTTPIGWIAAGVAALAGAAYLIYTNWDTIGPWLSEKWEQIKKIFSDAWNWLKAFDWSSILPDWSGWLPEWNWSSIIPAISLPSFDWKSLLPDWNWSSIIPSMPDFGSWFGGGSSGPKIESAADMAELAQRSAQASKLIAEIGPAAQAAVQVASQALTSASFHSHGVALMATLAAGIRAGAGQAVEAVRGVTQQMRDYLPHSPAKVGPLSDLDRVRFSETLAGAIRPGPAVSAVRSVTAGMRGLLSGEPLSGGLPAGGGTSGGGVTVQVNYNPTLSVQGDNAQALQSSFAQQLRDHADVLARLVDQAVRDRQRLAY
ncbi:phage tail tape-measure protein [Ancylobacter sp. 3268]|uniref:tape measure protein n=1 Tax=Ancylobacter sp. 3268 TaxID=2817752 RepID=UPI00285FF08D|nr:tape measure protein [Ancylobacter sp. 3268]MDR6952682.1 phage tail tape-measure protein [Ancylobacter sp. 3268]